MSKYKNIKCVVGGHKFDSKREAAYYSQLLVLQKAVMAEFRVEKIELQVKFELIPKQDGERAVHYVADFRVEYADGRIEVVDVKSEMTRKLRAYVLKRKMMLYRHGIRIMEIY